MSDITESISTGVSETSVLEILFLSVGAGFLIILLLVIRFRIRKIRKKKARIVSNITDGKNELKKRAKLKLKTKAYSKKHVTTPGSQLLRGQVYIDATDRIETPLEEKDISGVYTPQALEPFPHVLRSCDEKQDMSEV